MKRILVWIVIAIIAAHFALQLQKVLVYSETAMLPKNAESYKAKQIIDKYFPEMKNNTMLFVEMNVNVTSDKAWNWYWNFKKHVSVNTTSIYDIWNATMKGLNKFYDAGNNLKNMYKGVGTGLNNLWAAADVIHYIMVMNGLYDMDKQDAIATFQAIAAGTPLQKMTDLAEILYDLVHKTKVDPLKVDERFTLKAAYIKLEKKLTSDYAKHYLACLYNDLQPLAKGKQYWLNYPMEFDTIKSKLKILIEKAEPKSVKCFATWFAEKVGLPKSVVVTILYDAYKGIKPNIKELALITIMDKAGDLIRTMFVSKDWKATTIRISTNDYQQALEIKKLALETGKGIITKVYLLGPSVINKELQKANIEDAERVQELSHVLVLAVLFALTQSIVASFIPFIVVGIGIITGMALAYFIGLVVPIYHIARTLMITTGLGLGMDYSIFILARFKEEAVKGKPPKEAARVAARRAGHAVAISAIAASLGFLSLALSGTLMLNSMGITIPLTVIATALAAITLLPEILGIIGEKRWFWWPSKLVVKEEEEFRYTPRIGFVIAIFIISLILTAFALNFYVHYKGTSNTMLFLPKGTEVYEALQEFSKKFPPGAWGPIYVVAKDNKAMINNFVSEVQRLPDVAAVINPNKYPQFKKDGIALIIVVPNSQPFSDKAMNLVKEIRKIRPEGWLVGGQPAELLDTNVLVTKAFWSRVAPFAIVATMLVLLLATRRLPPVVSAAYSLLAAISWAVTLSHFISVLAWGSALYWITPLIAFVATLGIGTDYNVFYISRVLEEIEKKVENPVWAPIKSVAPIILGLASIMASAYFGMLIARAVALKQMGLALGFSAVFAAINASLLNPITLTVIGMVVGGVYYARKKKK